MKKRTKIWIILAASLIASGLILFGGIMTVLKWDFSKLLTNEYVTNTHRVTESYQNISVDTTTADLLILPSEDGQTKVICQEEVRAIHLVTVQDGTLVIKQTDDRKWYDHIGIHIPSPKLTVYLPEAEYGALSVKLTTGDITVSKDFCFESMNLSATTGDFKSGASVAGLLKMDATTGEIRIENCSIGALDLSVTTGDIVVSSVTCAGEIREELSTGDSVYIDVTCQSFISDATTGDLQMKNVIATEQFKIERSTGDVHFDGCDAAELLVEATTGDVIGSLLSEKIFIAHASTGKVNVPKSTSGGECRITTSTGDIQIRLQ